jgi:hypothetical protein
LRETLNCNRTKAPQAYMGFALIMILYQGSNPSNYG